MNRYMWCGFIYFTPNRLRAFEQIVFSIFALNPVKQRLVSMQSTVFRRTLSHITITTTNRVHECAGCDFRRLERTREFHEKTRTTTRSTKLRVRFYCSHGLSEITFVFYSLGWTETRVIFMKQYNSYVHNYVFHENIHKHRCGGILPLVRTALYLIIIIINTV